ncbi:uncharacterized protein RCC_07280 [Ramularia collo-cygni]|uniref:F-box domain-containing protein n=1 Tax=Ramularia collo-cygni TaxID=112498 RepID=A0A2D3V9H8_9PEZI|nr:uncharacterized protein RCC_07280 [Ramularia collo-cygni]CZT21417.1 uncharacterized protein RCC_07280 [Ramularia collo-cygni]
MEGPDGDDISHKGTILTPTEHSDSNTLQDKKHNLTTLPLEVRWLIYDHLSHNTAFHPTNPRSPRRCFRLDWTTFSKSLPDHGLGEIAPLATTCRQLRVEILPTLFKSVIVKFPAWNEDFKTQCLYWIDHVSELTIRSVDCLWLEGVYWRLCLRLGKECGEGWEEADARKRDWRQFSGFVEKEGEGFAIKVEFFDSVKAKAEVAAEMLRGIVAGMLDGMDEKELGKKELRCLVSGAGLEGWEPRGVFRRG